jgi:hypothetical protein
MSELNVIENHLVESGFTKAELADPIVIALRGVINAEIRQLPIGLTSVHAVEKAQWDRARVSGLTDEQIEWTIQNQHCVEFVSQGVERASIIPAVEEFDNGTRHYILSGVVLSDQQFVSILDNIVRGVVKYLREPVLTEECVKTE